MHIHTKNVPLKTKLQLKETDSYINWIYIISFHVIAILHTWVDRLVINQTKSHFFLIYNY